ncbi:hypothetical protein HUT03_04355 [Candidatus Liberibacter africanus]|uniref:Uncharacterized protein n=1 Tax=Candidatus Liberibacter africanus PTSAPSY TaxID=1277257 RepID=A0A0G3I9M3_LIBAF|nr:hypothetical protein [Candidatus Liberibacter africanus]AKK20477.1 hypothetical protein G293_04275 [Candidatus Liberibacter africanus PTSAPSY]QTP64194.1 hypothetical protein HUT03_04355 [Candidatus Liberibacter africanus]
MLRFKTFSDIVNELIEETKPEQKPRKYLGASVIGDPCSHKLQYHLTQTPKDEEFSSRTLRIFDKGHAFE